MDLMRTFLACLMMVATCNAQQVVTLGGQVFTPEKWEAWLTIEVVTGDLNKTGVQPRTTRITSKYQPVFRQTRTGVWEITFLP